MPQPHQILDITESIDRLARNLEARLDLTIPPQANQNIQNRNYNNQQNRPFQQQRNCYDGSIADPFSGAPTYHQEQEQEQEEDKENSEDQGSTVNSESPERPKSHTGTTLRNFRMLRTLTLHILRKVEMY